MTDIRFPARAFGSAVLLAGVLVVACSDDGTDDPGDGAQPDPQALFRNVQEELVATCGGANGSCHVRGAQAPRWLADPDPYASARAYRGILPVTRDSSDSILLTQVQHAGPALSRYPVLYDKVAAWIQSELPKPILPATPKFSVQDGFNVVPLDTLAPNLSGARLTFLAAQANSVLTLSALRVEAPITANLTIKSPFFVMLPRSGKVVADPSSNGFEGDLTVEAGTTQELFGGKMILLRWDRAGQLKLVFNDITSTPGQGASQKCTALDVFRDKALPAMQTQVDILADDTDGGVPGPVIGKGSCIGCHGKEPAAGDPPEPAVQAMDLRAWSTAPADACAQARNRIDFADKTKSALLLNPQGKGNPNHPMKSLAESDPVLAGIDAWIQAEQR